MSEDTGVSVGKKKKMSMKRKAEVFDSFVQILSGFLFTEEVLAYLGGRREIDDVRDGDYGEVLHPFFEFLSEEEIDEVLQKLLPKILEEEYGAKKVTIKW